MWKRGAIFRIHIVNEGKSQDREISKTSFVIGRGDASDLQITTLSISRSHLSVELRDSGIWLKDLGSASGTKLNGVNLTPNKPEIYKTGDVVNLGLSDVILTIALAKDEKKVSGASPLLMILDKVKKAAGHLLSESLPAIPSEPSPIEEVPPDDSSMEASMDKTMVDPNYQKIIRGTVHLQTQVSRDNPIPEQILEEAKASALRIKIAAETETIEIMQQAEEKAHFEITTAREKAEEIVRQAMDQAFRIQRESESESLKMRQAMHTTIEKTHQEFEQKSDVFRRESREKSEQLIREAREKGEKTLLDYQSRSEKLLSDARMTATTTKSNAQKEADAILGQAYQKTADLKNVWESDAKTFQEKEKRKSEELLIAAQEEADQILEEAQRTSSMIRAKIEKELDEIQKNAEEKAIRIRTEARESADQILAKAHEEAKNTSGKIIALTKTQGEEQKLEVLQGAIEEAARIKENASREAKKEALTLLKIAENDRSGLTKVIEKLSQDILVQEKKKMDITHSIKTLQKKNSDLKDQFEVLAAKLTQTEIETNKVIEELGTKTRAAEGLLETGLAAFEKHKQENQKVLDSIKHAETLTKNAKDEKDRLVKSIENLKKEENQLTKALQLQTQQIDAEKLRLREAAEKEIKTYKDEANNEIKNLRDKALADFNQRKDDQEVELSKMKTTELETIKGLRAKKEAKFKTKRKHQILEMAKSLETYLAPRIKEGLESANMFPELKSIVERVIEEEFYEEGDNTNNSSSKTKRRNVYIVVGAGIATLIAVLVVPYRGQVKQKAASELFIERLHLEEAQKPKFIPKITDEFKESYTDNVIYTKDYVNFKLNPDNQSKWIQDLNKFFVNDLGLNENAIVKFISIESNLVNQLNDLRTVIHYESQNEEIQKMADLEKDTVKDMIGVLGTQGKYKSFRAFEKRYYSSNRQPANSNTETPTAAPKQE